MADGSVWEGTNTGPLTMPDGSELPPTGAVVSVPYVGVHTVRGGLFVSSHYYWDQMAFLKPLGLLRGGRRLERHRVAPGGGG